MSATNPIDQDLWLIRHSPIQRVQRIGKELWNEERISDHTYTISLDQTDTCERKRRSNEESPKKEAWPKAGRELAIVINTTQPPFLYLLTTDYALMASFSCHTCLPKANSQALWQDTLRLK